MKYKIYCLRNSNWNFFFFNHAEIANVILHFLCVLTVTRPRWLRLEADFAKIKTVFRIQHSYLLTKRKMGVKYVQYLN